MKKQVKRYLGSIVLGITLATVGVAGQVQALTVFNQTNGSLSAEAQFNFAGGDLTVTLSNTSGADVLIPSQVLTAVFFSSDGGGGLIPQSALLNAGSSVVFGPNGGGDVGGEWAYASGLVGAPLGATQGISSAGLGLFGGANFGVTNLDGPIAVNGLGYGLTSAGDNTGTGNAGVTGNVPLIKSAVSFNLSAPTNFSESSISNVSFLYGTALPPATVPEPTSALLLGGGLVAVGLWRRFRKAA